MTDTDFAIEVFEVEKALIGSLLINPDYLAEVDLKPDLFTHLGYRQAFCAMTSLQARSETVNIVTVATELKAMGGSEFTTLELAMLTNGVPLASYQAVMTYQATMRRLARNREALTIASEIAKAGYSGGDVVNVVASLSERFIKEQSGDGSGVRPVSVYGNELYDEVQEAIANPREFFGFATGLPQFDTITGGIKTGEVVVLGGEPGVGKSTLAIQLCVGMARNGHAGAIYELEMTGKNLVRRVVAHSANVSGRYLQTGRLTPDEIERFTASWGDFNTLPIYIDDNSAWTTVGLKADIARAKAKYGIGWVLIDYIELLTDEPGLPYTERSGLISDRIHQIAKDLEVAVIAVNGITKAGMNGEGSGLAAFAGSRRVTFNAHQVISLKADGDNAVRLKWEKFRDGVTGSYMRLERVPGQAAFREA